MILLAAQFGTEKFVVHEKDVKECEACQREGSQGSTTKSMHTMVRLVVISLLLILLGTLDPLVQGFAAASRGSSRPAVDDSPVDPNAKHRTHRLQHPGKHKEGAWFLGEEQHKKLLLPSTFIRAAVSGRLDGCLVGKTLLVESERERPSSLCYGYLSDICICSLKQLNPS